MSFPQEPDKRVRAMMRAAKTATENDYGLGGRLKENKKHVTLPKLDCLKNEIDFDMTKESVPGIEPVRKKWLVS